MKLLSTISMMFLVVAIFVGCKESAVESDKSKDTTTQTEGDAAKTDADGHDHDGDAKKDGDEGSH